MRITSISTTPRRRAHPPARDGRVLVECCVGLLLLSVCSTLVLLAAAGTATLVDAAALEDRVQRVESTVAARVQLDACALGVALPAPAWGPRLSVSEVHVTTASLHSVQLLAAWQGSAFASSAGRSLVAATAGICE